MTQSRSLISVQHGTFSPILQGATVAGSNTYTAATRGEYQKIGRWVTCKGIVALATRDAAMDGQLQIGGFPFKALNDSTWPQHSEVLRLPGAMNLSANNSFAIISLVNNQTYGGIWQMGGNDAGTGSNMSPVTSAIATGLLSINFSIRYKIEP